MAATDDGGISATIIPGPDTVQSPDNFSELNIQEYIGDAAIPHPFNIIGNYSRFFLVAAVLIIFALLIIHIGVLFGGTLSSADYF